FANIRRPDDAVEFLQGILVVDDAIDVGDREARLPEAKLDGMAREGGIVLDPREPLLLPRRDDAAVDQQGRCRIVKVERQAEHLHAGIPRQRPLSMYALAMASA